ncbi:hypothetical protein D5272_05775 [bacterium D16-76]|nr:hypothetical protein [bacterium D16-76]
MVNFILLKGPGSKGRRPAGAIYFKSKGEPKMKKLVLVLAALLMAVSMAACSGTDAPSAGTSSTAGASSAVSAASSTAAE